MDVVESLTGTYYGTQEPFSLHDLLMQTDLLDEIIRRAQSLTALEIEQRAMVLGEVSAGRMEVTEEAEPLQLMDIFNDIYTEVSTSLAKQLLDLGWTIQYTLDGVPGWLPPAELPVVLARPTSDCVGEELW